MRPSYVLRISVQVFRTSRLEVVVEKSAQASRSKRTHLGSKSTSSSEKTFNRYSLSEHGSFVTHSHVYKKEVVQDFVLDFEEVGEKNRYLNDIGRFQIYR